MAEIPVEHKKSGIPWWVWLLLALLVLGLLFWLFSGDDDVEDVAATTPVVNEAVAPAPVDTAAAAPAAAGPITDLAMITGATDLSTMAGRQVQLAGVPVQAVVGDRTFFIGQSDAQRAFVVLNEQPTPADPVEGRYDVEPGQVVNVNGVVRSVTDPAFNGQPIEGLPAGQNTVIHAQSLDIVSRS